MGAKSKIDWCDSTWNPVTGCLHGCEYCYARNIANRFRNRKGYEINEDNVTFIHHFDGSPTIYELNVPCYYDKIGDWKIGDWKTPTNIKAPYPYGFAPTFHRYKLDEPQKWKKGRNIFVCSMADLFGNFIPDSWLEEVLAACEKAPQHNYLFLTKNPGRYEKILDGYMPDNMWFGWSQTEPSKYRPDFLTHYSVQTFISIEPLLKPFDKFIPQWVGWVIIGAETGNRKGKVIPKRGWIEDIVDECRKADIPVFMKESLAKIWGKPLIQEYPERLRK